MNYYFSKGKEEKFFNNQSNLRNVCINNNEYTLKLKSGKWKSLYKRNGDNNIVGIVFYNALCSNYDNAMLFKKELVDNIDNSNISLYIDKNLIIHKNISLQEKHYYFYHDKNNNLIAIEII